MSVPSRHHEESEWVWAANRGASSEILTTTGLLASQPHASTRSRSPSDAAAPSHSTAHQKAVHSPEKKRTRDRHEDTRLESGIAASNESNPCPLEVIGQVQTVGLLAGGNMSANVG